MSSNLVGRVSQAVKDLGKLKPKEGDVISIIHDVGVGGGGGGDPALALQYFYFVKFQEGFRHNSSTYWKMITVLLPEKGRKRLEHIKKMLEELRDEGQANKVIYEKIMTSYAQAGNLGDAVWVVNCVRGHQLPWENIRAYFILLMKVLLNCNLNEHVLIVGDQVRAEFKLNEESYSYMIRAAAKIGMEKFQMVYDLMMKMAEDKLFTTTVEFSAVIHMCAKAKDVEWARYWFDFVGLQGIQHDNLTYTAMMRAYLEGNCIADAEKIVTDMLKTGNTPNSHTAAMILGCTTPSHPQKMDILYKTGHGSYPLIYCTELKDPLHDFMLVLLQSEQYDGMRRTVDCVVNYAHNIGWKDRACTIWDEAVVLKLYQLKANIPDTSELKIDLHGLSVGTAIVALARTLFQMSRDIDSQPNTLPNKLTIITGRGLHSVQGVSSLKEAINKLLLNSRFPMNPNPNPNAGSVSVDGLKLKWWFEQTHEGSRIVEIMHTR